jgi:hypothetical protein
MKTAETDHATGAKGDIMSAGNLRRRPKILPFSGGREREPGGRATRPSFSNGGIGELSSDSPLWPVWS